MPTARGSNFMADPHILAAFKTAAERDFREPLHAAQLIINDYLAGRLGDIVKHQRTYREGRALVQAQIRLGKRWNELQEKVDADNAEAEAAKRDLQEAQSAVAPGLEPAVRTKLARCKRAEIAHLDALTYRASDVMRTGMARYVLEHLGEEEMSPELRAALEPYRPAYHV